MKTGTRSRLRSERIPRRYGCTLCGRRDVAETPSGVVLCGRCRKELCPTPMDRVLDALDMTIDEFAHLTGLGRMTVVRASKGIPVPERAEELARVTGFAAEVFR